MRDIVRGAVGGEEEGGDLCVGRVVACRCVEFEVVEQGEGCDEEGGAPEGVLQIG